MLRARGIAQVIASGRSWVRSPVLKKKEKIIEDRGIDHEQSSRK
jgi:hypothetical protein